MDRNWCKPLVTLTLILNLDKRVIPYDKVTVCSSPDIYGSVITASVDPLTRLVCLIPCRVILVWIILWDCCKTNVVGVPFFTIVPDWIIKPSISILVSSASIGITVVDPEWTIRPNVSTGSITETVKIVVDVPIVIAVSPELVLSNVPE